MYKQALMGDAWIREAQEASKLVEDIETRVKNKNPSLKHQENRLVDITARSKLLEAGIKLDRLESLLRNPPSKPILTVTVHKWLFLTLFVMDMVDSLSICRTNEDLDYRWKMLSELQLRTKALALSLYALPTSSRPGCLTPENAEAINTNVSDCEQDQTKSSSSRDDPELLRPLISNDVTLQSQVQMKQCGTSTSLSLLQKVFWIFGAVLGSAALIFILVLICAVI
ncbi:Syntaxin of plants 52, putative isoform 1 [Theobroma cacao]|uniref:Syntaxin of plants 52, putative isoform 1 n=1 Tax=Theobroma cacao TaxID=3641 RepID=A0A061F271_THECC|nr:Syntaxin of plants 52, putative isoform 1 [Theobroma cacao]